MYIIADVYSVTYYKTVIPVPILSVRELNIIAAFVLKYIFKYQIL